MGMFDSIIFSCPNCGKELEAQSKAGECTLERFSHKDAPTVIAADCLGDLLVCKCGKRYEVTTPFVFLPLTLKETDRKRYGE